MGGNVQKIDAAIPENEVDIIVVFRGRECVPMVWKFLRPGGQHSVLFVLGHDGDSIFLGAGGCWRCVQGILITLSQRKKYCQRNDFIVQTYTPHKG